jgi:GNAT superfamily N-acetyltransferase
MSAGVNHYALFLAGAFRAVEMKAEGVPELQQFYEANPEYHMLVTGAMPSPQAAQETFDARPPNDWPFTRKWTLAFRDRPGAMVAIADVIEDLFVEHVWHIGLFIVATSLHGGGAAPEMYRHLESWMRGRGATWSRLGVVIGNDRAERFWEREGYAEIRKRENVRMGERVNTLRTMVKPLAGGSLQEYLASVAHDRI